MSNISFSAKYHVFQAHLFETLLKRKTRFSLLFVLAFSLTPILRVFRAMNSIGGNLQAFECFVLMSNSVQFFSCEVLAIMALYANSPSVSDYTMYEIVRTGQKVWLRATILTTLFVSFFMPFILLLFSAALSSVGGANWQNTWSSTMRTIAIHSYTGTPVEGLYFPYEQLFTRWSPYSSALISLLFNSGYLFIISLLILSGNLIIPLKGSGIFISLCAHLFGYIIYANGPLLMPQQFSLLSCSFAALYTVPIYQLNEWNTLIIALCVFSSLTELLHLFIHKNLLFTRLR